MVKLTFLKNNKTALVAGLIGLVTISGAVAYYQYKKIIDYTITFKRMKINKLSKSLFNFDVYFDYLNKAKVAFVIVSQKYDIYIQGIYVTTMVNNNPTNIAANGVSVLALNVQFDPRETLKRLGATAETFLMNAANIKIKIVSSLKVKLWMFTINIHYTYEDTLKNMLA